MASQWARASSVMSLGTALVSATMRSVTGLVRGRGPAGLVRVVAECRRVGQQQARILAEQHQLIIDAEVGATRRALLRALRQRGGVDAAALLDWGFLAVADRPTVYGRSWMPR